MKKILAVWHTGNNKICEISWFCHLYHSKIHNSQFTENLICATDFTCIIYNTYDNPLRQVALYPLTDEDAEIQKA